MAAQSFDLIVIGTGVAGSSPAQKCAGKGKNVAIIDYRPFGGTCQLRGCDPKKILVGAASIIDQNQRMQGNGIDSDAHINWQDLIAFKRAYTDPVPDKKEESMREAGITVFHGKASFLDEQTISINDQEIVGEKILVATGNKPSPIPIKGFEHLTTSDTFMELDELPEKIVFVGGGYISFEFAHVAVRAGADVTILHRSEQPLKSFDSDMVDVLLEKTKDLGISVHLNRDVQSVEQTSNGFKTTTKHDDDTETFSSDLVVHGAGRVPQIEALDLDKAHIDYSKKGVKVNDYMQSVSNGRIYAAGDVAASDGLPLTPPAGFESSIVMANILEGNHKKAEYPAQPSVVFTIPPLSTVGLTEAQAEEQGYNIDVKFQRTDEWYSSRRTNESHTAFKTITNKDNGQILGAHILGQHAAELINLFAAAVNKEIPADELKHMIFAYPTLGSNISAMV
jgi:glutathione reductase (NADPH)